jgi:hypothetical protein
MDKIEQLLEKAVLLSKDMAKVFTAQHYELIKRLVLLEQEIEQAKKDLPTKEVIDFAKKPLSDNVTASPIPPSDDIELPEPDIFAPDPPGSRKNDIVEKSKEKFGETNYQDDLPF